MTKIVHRTRFRLSASPWDPTERKTSYFFWHSRCQNRSDPSLIPAVYFSYLRLHLLCPNCHSFISHQLFPAFRAAVSHPRRLNESKDRFKTCQLPRADHHRLLSVCEETRYLCLPRAPFFPLLTPDMHAFQSPPSLSYPADFICRTGLLYSSSKFHFHHSV